jgi:hypothetical protein
MYLVDLQRNRSCTVALSSACIAGCHPMAHCAVSTDTRCPHCFHSTKYIQASTTIRPGNTRLAQSARVIPPTSHSIGSHLTELNMFDNIRTYSGLAGAWRLKCTFNWFAGFGLEWRRRFLSSRIRHDILRWSDAQNSAVRINPQYPKMMASQIKAQVPRRSPGNTGCLVAGWQRTELSMRTTRRTPHAAQSHNVGARTGRELPRTRREPPRTILIVLLP